jgi:hypothetical protein
LIKMLVASGLVAAGSSLPGEWFSPEVEMGVLPAHAQVSPVPPYTVTECFVDAVEGDGGDIYPWDDIWGYCGITPADSGIEMQQTITLNEDGHPQNGVVRVETGVTDSSGMFSPSDFDLGTLQLSPGDDRVTVTWEFVDPADGTGSCENLIDIVRSPE